MKQQKYKVYHDSSKNATSSQNNHELKNPANWPKEWTTLEVKSYPRFNKIKLIDSKKTLNVPLLEAIHNRQSVKPTKQKTSLNFKDFSMLLRNSLSFKESDYKKNLSLRKRVYPSAGARYPLECYVLVNDIKGIEKGLYHYELTTDSLEQLLSLDLESKIEDILGEYTGKCSALIILTSVSNRNMMKYGERGYRFALIEAGHIMQNLCLISTALNINLSPFGGFIDVQVSRLLDLDEEREIPLYCCTIS